MNQSKTKKIHVHLADAGITIGLGSTADWMKKWHEF